MNDDHDYRLMIWAQTLFVFLYGLHITTTVENSLFHVFDYFFFFFFACHNVFIIIIKQHYFVGGRVCFCLAQCEEKRKKNRRRKFCIRS